MNDSRFADFERAARAAGFDEALVREWAPNSVTGTHTHPFAVQARVERGEFWLTVDGDVRHFHVGDAFSLAREVPHAERYGETGATVWVARRHAGDDSTAQTPAVR